MKFSIEKKYLCGSLYQRSIFLLTIIVSLSSHTALGSNVPDFYTSPKADDLKYFYGEGVGESCNDAIVDAKLSVASSFKTRVSQETELTETVNNQNTKSRLFTQTKTQTEEVEFSRVDTLSCITAPDTHYAQIRVDRQHFAADNLSKLKSTSATTQRLFDSLATASSVEKFISAVKIRESIAVKRRLIDLVSYADPAFDHAEHERRYLDYAAELDRIESGYSTLVDTRGVDTKIAQEIEQYFTQYGFTFTSDPEKNTAQSNGEIKLKSNIDFSKDNRGAHIASLTINLTARAEGKIVGESKALVFKARDYSSKADAFDKTVALLAILLQKTPPPTLLGATTL